MTHMILEVFHNEGSAFDLRTAKLIEPISWDEAFLGTSSNAITWHIFSLGQTHHLAKDITGTKTNHYERGYYYFCSGKTKKFETSGNSNKVVFRIIVRVISFVKWWVRQRISGSKKRGGSDETKHSRSEGMAKWSVQVMDVRRSDKSFITNLKNMEKGSIFSSRIITETNIMTNFRHILC